MRLIDADALHTDIDQAPTVNPYEWISVKDRLPEKRTRVLCYSKYEPESPDVICENEYLVGGLWRFDGSKVTHWMPLPPLPKTEEG